MTEDGENSGGSVSIDEREAAEIEAELDGRFTVPSGTSEVHRRRLLGAIGGAGTVALAGCLGMFEEEEEDDEEADPEETATPEDDDEEADPEERQGYLDYTALDHMMVDFVPDRLVVPLDVQVAYTDDEVWFRFQFDAPDPHGWYHDMLLYEDGEWRELDAPNPEIADPDYGATEWHEGFTEDRVHFLLSDGSVTGFAENGGWLTVHEGTRSLPGAVEGEAVEDHPHHGDVLGNDDVRKYLPQSRNGEWWENDWDDVKDTEELKEMLDNNEFLELPIWRGHRSNPAGWCTSHYVLDHRHGIASTYSSQDWTAEDGPTYMFDPDVVDEGALDLEDMYDGNIDQQAYEEYALLEGENTTEFDPDVAEYEGAVIPRRVLYDAEEGWRANGVKADGTWTVEMWRERDPGTDGFIPIDEEEVYEWAPAVHWGSEERWHHVGYTYEIGFGTEPDFYGESQNLGDTELVAEKVDGEPDWGNIETYTIPLMYPGQTDWTWLVSGEHPRVDEIRNAEINLWEYHDEDPEAFAQRMVDLEESQAPRK